MALEVQYRPYTLDFKFEAGTSRGVLTRKNTWFLLISDTENPSCVGIGECGPLAGLSLDDRPDFEANLSQKCKEFNELDLEIFDWNIPIILNQLVGSQWPSIRMGLETAMLDFLNGGKRIIFDNDFVQSKRNILINGLIWMGKKDFMLQQIEEKLAAGFRVLKLKVGAIDFEEECSVLHQIRARFSSSDVELRLDANGAFGTANALEKLKKLAEYDIHSIEQPIQTKQTDSMAELCQQSPIAIALDEELIGSYDYAQKRQVIKNINPAYIILKPSLLGGFIQTREWIETAHRLGIGWWLTSALESNIGLNAIAQFTAEFSNPLPQGLGTGQLYTNNIDSPLDIENGFLKYNTQKSWAGIV
jgi:o-succinylbenzoate synthase